MMKMEDTIMDRIAVRRRLHRQRRQRQITEMQPLSFSSDRSDLDCSVIHVFDTERGDIALSLQTARGSITVTLPLHLANDMAQGICKLIRQRLPRYDGDPVD